MDTAHDKRLMELAINIAAGFLRQDKMPVGAIVAAEGKVLGLSNLPNPFTSKYFGHAEMVALNFLEGRPSRDSKITVYTTMEPCVMCMGAILHFPVSRVVYALEDPHGGACSRLEKWVPPRHQGRLPKIVGGLMREESRLLMKEWLTSTKDTYWSGPVGQATELYKTCMQ